MRWAECGGAWQLSREREGWVGAGWIDFESHGSASLCCIVWIYVHSEVCCYLSGMKEITVANNSII